MSSGKPQRNLEVELFIDECLGRREVPETLRRAGAKVITHHEEFPAGTDDAVWLSAIARHPEWVVLTKDAQIRRRPLELEALTNARARVFTLTSANLTGEQQATAFLRALPKIKEMCRRRRGPFIAKVTADGSVEVLRIKKPKHPKRRKV